MSSKNTRAARAAHARAMQEFRTYDTTPIQPKRSKLPLLIVGVVIVVAILAAVIFGVLHFVNQEPAAALLPEAEQAIIEVEEGEGASDIAQALYDAGLISHTKDFLKQISSMGAEGSLIPGAYVFTGGTSSDDIIAALLEGPASTGFKLTVPEGLTREATAEIVESATGGHVSAQQFLDATADASVYAGDFAFLQSAGTNNLEGYLFPKTYTVTMTDDAQSVVKMMLSQFQEETAGLDFAYASKAGLSQYQAVILASIVEKESSTEVMPQVASVFYNRLASDRPYLESDATTAYEVGHDPTAEEVHADTPYSTYTHAGLPPTAICSPSIEALQAVCAPEATDYMYFYFTADGQYYFSKTYEEHKDAISGTGTNS
jgi:UPF0755 protein